MSTASSAASPNYRIYDRTGGGVTEDIYAESLDDAIERGREWITDGEWGDFQGTLNCVVREIVRYDDSEDDGEAGKIDERATNSGQSYDCSAEITADEPDCDEAARGGHDWQTPHKIVGGCTENPGVWGSGHGSVKCTVVCAKCGMYRTTDYGATQICNGQQMTRVTYTEVDEKSEAFVREERAKAEGRVS